MTEPSARGSVAPALARAQDHLPAAVLAARENADLVSAAAQRVHDRVGEGRLHVKAQPVRPAEARRVQRGLGVVPLVEQVDEHLHVRLGLHVTAHDAERAQGLAVPRQEPGNDGVVRVLARRDDVGVALGKGEARAAVLQADARARHEHAGPEALVEALDHGDAVALSIGGAEVDRVPARRGRRRARGR